MNRRGILFVSAPGLLAVGLFLSGPSAANSTPESMNELRAHPLHGGCGAASANAPTLEGVRLSLMSELGADQDRAASTDEVRETLRRTYGSRVSENVTPMAYSYRWDPVYQKWVLVCSSASEFQIDFGSEGSIVVESRDTRLVRK